ncbi:FAD-dependent tricarballylate dehydrogenase TcuA, partial [Rhodospirillum rubrum]|uniref:FAD-dependent tricarballylate dehydrogenase TcuA n=1 Tax=Rhodospirillum rubrum TaxID=1085 RepID=UPI0028AD9730
MMTHAAYDCDVLVIGGGMAALCAAIAARRAGVSVRLVDAAPKALRGGNSRHSRNFRLAHDTPTPLVPGRYPLAEFREDLITASGGLADPALIEILCAGSSTLPDWLAAQGVDFQAPAEGALPWSRKTVFLRGGGKAMVNALYATCHRLGVVVENGWRASAVALADGPQTIALTGPGGALALCPAKTVILGSGGYQGDRLWLAETWGDQAAHFHNRGSPLVDGALLKALFAAGAARAGVAGACHLVAVDARSPREDGGIVTRVDGMPWGIVVDDSGRRFADEGAVIGPPRYSTWGRLVAGRPRALAHVILDSAGLARSPASIYPPISAMTPAALAEKLALPVAPFVDTLLAYNRAISGTGDGTGDDAHTLGLIPAKSRLARPLNAPPFHAYPMRPGTTFTGEGVGVDGEARVRRGENGPCLGLFAAGMIMAPALLGAGYLSGAALTIGGVFGRLAGEGAARRVRS